MILEESELRIAASRSDLVIICAFPMNKKGEELATGLQFIEQVLQISAEASVQRFINISTQSVYGSNRKQAASGDTPIAPDDFYSVGKYMVEMLTDAYLKNIPHLNVQLASLLAPEKDTRFVNKFIDQVIGEKPISVATGEQNIQFLDV